MFNETLSFFDIFILFLTIVSVIRAIYWNIRASLDGMFRTSMIRAAIFASVYLIGYIFLLFTNVTSGTWSDIFRSIAPLVYYYVWADPPKKWYQSKEELANRLEEAVIERITTSEQKGRL